MLGLKEILILAVSVVVVAITLLFLIGGQLATYIETLSTLLILGGTITLAGLMFFIIFQIVYFVEKH